MLPPFPLQAPGIGAMASRKPAARSAVKLDTNLAAHLERRSRQIGASVNDAAIDRILATINLGGTTAILAPGVVAEQLDNATAAATKRARWGGEVRSILSFLTAMVRRRKLSAPRHHKRMARAAKALSEATVLMENDPAYEAALALAEMALDRVQNSMEDAKAWTNERIAGEFLPKEYWIFTKRPTMTRVSKTTTSGETVRFVRAVMRELKIQYSEESIIRAMQDAQKPKRYR